MAQLKQIWQSETKEDRISVTHLVHTIRLYYVDDPDIVVAEPIWEWQQTEAGKWVMENSCPKASWHRITENYGFLYHIRAYLTPQQITFFELKFK